MFFDVMESRKNVGINKAKDKVKNEVIRDIFLYLPVSNLEWFLRWYSRTVMMMYIFAIPLLEIYLISEEYHTCPWFPLNLFQTLSHLDGTPTSRRNSLTSYPYKTDFDIKKPQSIQKGSVEQMILFKA